MNEPSDLHRRATELFLRLCDLPEEERAGFLARECGSDPGLRREVESLLAHDQHTRDGFLDPCALRDRLAQTLETPSTAEPHGPLPERIGPFRIRRLLGAGGTGLVYEAEQDNPRRTVAVKVIRTGWASAHARRRFEFEKQVLGRLQHPGIAPIYEAGTAIVDHTPTPFFAMERVEGPPLMEYVESRGLSRRERLDLFVQICDAVQYAHHKGVIHRDLKPGNILVNEAGQSKILDFGIARATDSDRPVATDRTDLGSLVGTVPYMSPEQAAGDPDEIDTRSDVYALGVILYELLTGSLPYDVRHKLLHEAIRVIREDEPRRLGSVDEQLRGELETIVSKALEKDRAVRYQSASDLAADVQRHLSHQPIAARPPSPWYVWTKFTRRNRTLVGGVFTAAAILVAGVVGITLALAEARRNEQRAEEKAAEASANLVELERFSDGLLVERLEERARLLWPRVPEMVARYDQWLAEARLLTARRALHESFLETHRRTTYESQVAAGSIEPRPDGEPDWERTEWKIRWRDETARALVARLAALETLLADVEQRRDVAARIRPATVDAFEANWDTAITEIFLSDRYGGIEISPQVGLVPLGADPHSGLQEFWFWETGARPPRDPTTGRLLMTGRSGLVFVLVPAARFLLGAQWQRPDQPNHDPWATADESPVEVVVEPFFVSKYEMTAGQWQSIRGDVPNRYGPPPASEGRTHPVEMVTWKDCERVMFQLGLRLPHEAQWEHAARADTFHPWYTGPREESLAGYANLADLSAFEIGSKRVDQAYERWLRDGHITHAPVGCYGANAFGLHDVLGNVWEWCSNRSGFYERLVDETGHLTRESGEWHVYRGGGFDGTAGQARVSNRFPAGALYQSPSLGLRPVRQIVWDEP